MAIQNENRDAGHDHLQNYFRLYEKLAGMTGTAQTEANEFHRDRTSWAWCRSPPTSR